MKKETRRPSIHSTTISSTSSTNNLGTPVLTFLMSLFIATFVTSCMENPLGELTAEIDELPGLRPVFTSVSPSAVANDNNPIFTGTTLEDATVTIYSDSSCSTQVTTATADSNGDFTFTVTLADDVSVTYWANAIDADNKLSTCSTVPISYTEDSTAPALPVMVSTSPATKGESLVPTADGTAEASSIIEIFSDNLCTVSVGTGSAPGGNFSVATSLSANLTYSLYANATDASGNTSSCSSSTANYETYSIADGAAIFTGTDTIFGTNINIGTASSLLWSSGYVDETYYTHSESSSSDEVTVKVSGDYMISVIIPQTTPDVQRSAVSAEVYVNGAVVSGSIGDSGYIRYSSNHDTSSVHLNTLLTGLTIGDTIEVRVLQGGLGGLGGTVTIPSNATMYLEYIASSRTVFSGTSSTTVGVVTNLNQAAAKLEWTEDRKDTGYTHAAGSEDITLDAAGDYMVHFNLPIQGSVTRGSIKAVIQVNDGGLSTVGEAMQGYIRNSTGHTSSSVHFSGMVSTIGVNAVLSITVEQEGEAGTITTQTAPNTHIGTVFVEKLNTATNVFASSSTTVETGSANWNPTSIAAAEWVAAPLIDAGTYTQVTSHEVRLDTTGDYLIIYNDSLTSTGQRVAPEITAELDGTTVPGATCMSHYIRNSSAHTTASCNLVYYLRNVTAGQLLTLSTQAGAVTTTTNDTTDTLLTIIRKP